MPLSSFSETPHDVASHGVFKNASSMSYPQSWGSKTSSSTHQPRSWSKAEAPLNMKLMYVTPETSHALMSSLKDAAPEL